LALLVVLLVWSLLVLVLDVLVIATVPVVLRPVILPPTNVYPVLLALTALAVQEGATLIHTFASNVLLTRIVLLTLLLVTCFRARVLLASFTNTVRISPERPRVMSLIVGVWSAPLTVIVLVIFLLVMWLARRVACVRMTSTVTMGCAILPTRLVWLVFLTNTA